MRNLVAIFGVLFSFSALAISEKNYLEDYEKLVEPFYEMGKTKTAVARDGIKLTYHKIDRGSKKLIFILAGRTEAIKKYKEVVYDLKDLGYDFLLLDSRGQGNSQRELSDPQKGWVKTYKDYITDIEDLFTQIEVRKKYQEIVFIGHSMGGALGLRFAEINPKVFSKIIVNAPMLELKLDGKNEKVISMFMRLKILMGGGKDYIPGGGPTTQEYSFENNRVTSSSSRFEMARELERRDPDLIMGASTNNWVLEGIKLGKKTYKNKKKLFDTPMLMFQAGKEHFSRYKRQDKICSKHPSCKKLFLKDAKHELLMERDELRDLVIEEIKAFL